MILLVEGCGKNSNFMIVTHW